MSPYAPQGIRRWVLRNGLTVFHAPLPHARKLVALLGVRVGSTDERDGQGGTSHFLEHLAFKSTPRISCAEMSRRVESLGGSLNAFTDPFATVYELRAPAAAALRGFPVLYEAVVNTAFDRSEFAREREVVLTEIHGNLESPEEYMRSQLYMPALFGKSAVSRPIEGRPHDVEQLTVRDLVRWKRSHYRPGNAILAVAGACGRAELDDAIAETFARWRTAGPRLRIRRLNPRAAVTRRVEQWDDLEQAYLAVGVRTPPIGSSEAVACALLATVLGHGASSRLFRKLRDDHGIGYDILAEWESLGTVGHLAAVVPGFQPGRFAEAQRLIRREFERLATTTVGNGELARAKALMLAGHDDALDNPTFHAESLLYGEFLGLRDDYRVLKPRLDTVDAVWLRVVARRVFGRRFAVAALGPRASRDARKKGSSGNGAASDV